MRDILALALMRAEICRSYAADRQQQRVLPRAEHGQPQRPAGAPPQRTAHGRRASVSAAESPD